MSANNQVVIRKLSNECYAGYDVDIDAYYEPENADYYAELQPVFSTNTLEKAIKAYYKYCVELANSGMYVEYGLSFEGI